MDGACKIVHIQKQYDYTKQDYLNYVINDYYSGFYDENYNIIYENFAEDVFEDIFLNHSDEEDKFFKDYLDGNEQFMKDVTYWFPNEFIADAGNGPELFEIEYAFMSDAGVAIDDSENVCTGTFDTPNGLFAYDIVYIQLYVRPKGSADNTGINEEGSNENEGVAIDEVNFPDDIFRKYVSDNADYDNDGYLTENEADGMTGFSFYESYYPGITSLKGIEYFKNLDSLSCTSELFTELDLSQNTELKKLYLFNNGIKSIDLRNNIKLEELVIEYEDISKIDLSQNAELKRLIIHGTGIEILDISNNSKLVDNVNSNCTDASTGQAVFPGEEHRTVNVVGYSKEYDDRGSMIDILSYDLGVELITGDNVLLPVVKDGLGLYD